MPRVSARAAALNSQAEPCPDTPLRQCSSFVPILGVQPVLSERGTGLIFLAWIPRGAFYGCLDGEGMEQIRAPGSLREGLAGAPGQFWGSDPHESVHLSGKKAG